MSQPITAPIIEPPEVQYVVKSGGQPTAVLVPLTLWTTLVEIVQQLDAERREDAAIARDWLTRRQAAESPAGMGAVPWETVIAKWDHAPVG